jgi:uncharacterized membrane protein
MPFWKDPSRGMLTPGDEARVVAAIRAAERATTGEVRVHIDDHCDGEPLEQARRNFASLGMTATAARNGVLIYFAALDHKFAIVGDEGIHAVVGGEFWDALRDRLAARLREGRHAEGIVEAVLEVGRVLAEAFPAAADDRNELPDAVSWGTPRPRSGPDL